MDNWYRVSILGFSQGVIRSLGSSIIALSLCAGSVLVASASLAQQIDSDRDRQTAIQTAQVISRVTGVRINSTENGLQIILEAPTDHNLVPLILPEGKSLVKTIQNYQLKIQN